MVGEGTGATTAYPAPAYDESWIRRYGNLGDDDRRLVNAEMAAFTELFEAAFAGVPRRSIAHLDIGTCTGRYLRWGVTQGFGLTCGIDRSPVTTEYCARTLRRDGVHVYCADLLRTDELAATAGRHAPFRLVTMMLGTINHIDPAQRRGMLRSLASLMDAEGLLVLSSWRPGRCSLSLYSESERLYLEASALSERRVAELAEGSPLRLVTTVSTPWQLLAALSPRG
ncbi:MAG TPA: class I SAM-dependent methyltransferase [Streptosporangiaceae bacterium]|nr:class I SAM-dependent methyltransferase [Streptosporangiaceae bacterium]